MEGASDDTRHGRRRQPGDDRRDDRHDARHGRILPGPPGPGGPSHLAGAAPPDDPAAGEPARRDRQGGHAMTAITQRAEVIVIGAGQAGMAAGYYLAQAQIPYLILDAAPRAGEAWRQRWDTLELFTPARYSSLPGMRFPGDPGHYPGKDEVVGYMQAYARAFALPVRYNTRVTALDRSPGGYRLRTSAGIYEAGQVIVATGAYQQPWTPPIAAGLSTEVTQLHSAAYRNPAQFPGGKVLVVGAANSGAQIAADLAPTHEVWLSRGAPIRRLPRKILGIPIHTLGDRLGLIPAPFDTWRGRTQRGDLLVGPSLRQLARRHGIRLLGRATRARGRTVTF